MNLIIMTSSTLISLALLALSIQTASSFVPSSPTSITSKSTTNLFQSTATDFSLDEYLASKIVPIEAALKASVESKIPQTDKVCLFLCEGIMGDVELQKNCVSSVYIYDMLLLYNLSDNIRAILFFIHQPFIKSTQ